ncbi:MAG: 2-succinyl-5-enolpyruvyl-6-hydroxy-3-cyclohexene-1-carboxylic-acid synthase, partial [Cellulomonadaceae bacterium]|nr:2-succinyl-5-enolpyruvyl-6-hydroxy-3-cyclohexene-1-carboxylic-acid synthase [Cellulomonadaceae bacterium]
IITTSGTAVANLHPAVLEAQHCEVPLILLTADRPHELRGVGASQTTDQVGIFGTAVRYCADMPAPYGSPTEERDVAMTVSRAISAACGQRDAHPGPVHLNLAYRDPLHPTGKTPEPLPASAMRPVVEVVPLRPDPTGDPLLPGNRENTLVIAGDGAGHMARALAEAQGWPLMAEPSSWARGGPNSISGYRFLLGVTELTRDIEHVVVCGHPTLSRQVQALLARPDIFVTVVAPGGAPWPDTMRNASRVLDGLAKQWWTKPLMPQPVSLFLSRWLSASQKAASVLRDSTADASEPMGPLTVARAVAVANDPRDVLVVGASNPIRDLDLVLGLDEKPTQGFADTLPLVVSNRGVAGIDGTISTAVGVALAGIRPVNGAGSGFVGARQPDTRTRALIGDLTFLHDVGGLLVGPWEKTPDLQIVVVNDDGGSIFDTLEHGEVARRGDREAATVERVFATPQGVDIAHLCAGYGVRHRRIADVESLLMALAEKPRGIEVIEVKVPRTDRREKMVDITERVTGAVRATLR